MRRISMVIVGVVALTALLAADLARTTAVANGSFEVTLQPDGEPATADGVSIGRMTLDKTFTGDLAGDRGDVQPHDRRREAPVRVRVFAAEVSPT